MRIQGRFVNFSSSLAGANGEKAADTPTLQARTLLTEEVRVVPNLVRFANSLQSPVGASTAKNVGMNT